MTASFMEALGNATLIRLASEGYSFEPHELPAYARGMSGSALKQKLEHANRRFFYSIISELEDEIKESKRLLAIGRLAAEAKTNEEMVETLIGEYYFSGVCGNAILICFANNGYSFRPFELPYNAEGLSGSALVEKLEQMKMRLLKYQVDELETDIAQAERSLDIARRVLEADGNDEVREILVEACR
jgi:hypothetical protein